MKTIYEELSEERKMLQAEGLLPEWFTTAGWQLFSSKYTTKTEKDFKAVATRISKCASKWTDDPEVWEKKFFDVVWNGWLSCATPVLANMGTDRGCPVSCSGNYVNDSVYDFYESQKEVAVLSKNGFGTSSYLGAIRPRGADIKSGGKASGILPILKGFVQVSRDISQGSQRRGAWAGYIEIDHKDYWEIVNFINTNPDDCNIGWIITDEFIEKLNKGDKKAISRYQKAMKTKMVTGKGYFFFVDKTNRLNPQCYTDKNLKVTASQLCTEITLFSDVDHTYTCQPGFATIIKRGIGLTTLDNVFVGDHIWSNEGWTRVVNKINSGTKPVNEYFTSSGIFIGTHDHRIVQNGEKIEVKYAKSIDGCISPEYVFDDVKIIPSFVLNGLLLGDGTIRNDKHVLCVGENDKDYYGSEIGHLIKDNGYKFFRNLVDEKDCVVDIKNPVFARDFSINMLKTDNEKISFLRGLFSANGSVSSRKDGTIGVCLTQTSRDVAYKVFDLLNSLGFSPRIYKQKGESALFNNGEYLCKDVYRIYMLKNNDIKRFRENIGFIQKYKMDKLGLLKTDVISKPKNNSNKITDITFIGDFDVYHIEVDNPSHTYWTGGLNVSNCVLSSLNLAKYDEWKDTDTVFVSTVFLDCVASEFISVGKNIKGLDKAIRFTEKGRALGLGVMGFHTYLQLNMIPFESIDAHFKNVEIFKLIQEEAERATKWMAETFGEPEWCKGYNRRNTHLLAVAPTLSTAGILGGVSQGIEPVYKNVYVQGSAAGEMNRINPVFLDLLKRKGIYDDDHINEVINLNGSVQNVDWLNDDEKKVFKTAFEIDQKVIIRLASVRQQYIDQAQSINLFFSSDESEEYISEVHQMAFNDPMIKSLYYIRSESGVQASKGECESCAG